MKKGFTKRWRKRWDKGYHTDHFLWVLMDYFIDFANYKDRDVYLKNVGVVCVKRGQHLFGTRALADFFNVGRQQLRTTLKKLETIGFLTRKITHHYSIATVINYDTYQDAPGEANPPTNPPLTHGQPTLNHT